jgi:DNA repair protein SbcD/Mre11
MKYAHLSDIHIGGWRDPKLRELNMQAFLLAMDRCIAEQVDFILISGDLFNTSLPAIDRLNAATKKLKELKDKSIPVYIIAGSHDFSPTGKTMIDVLESAGLLKNVCKGQVIDKKLRLKFTVDKKTGAKITGMIGKRGMLDRMYYEDLNRELLEQEDGYKIFMFHTALTELKPKHLEQMESYPLSLLPKGFNYYAGGHVHHKDEYSDENYKKVTQPGALFPNNFKELADYGHGGFFLIEDEQVEWVAVKTKEHIALIIDCEGKNPTEVKQCVINATNGKTINNTIITLRFKGMLTGGRAGDVNMKEITDWLYNQGAYSILKNTSALTSEEFEEIKIQEQSIDEIEDTLIKEHMQQIQAGFTAEQEVEKTKALIAALTTDKKEGENAKDFEERIKNDALHVVGIQ